MPSYARIPNEIFDYHSEHIGGSAVALYIFLAGQADNKTGLSSPSTRLISQRLNLSAPTIRKFLHRLADHGLIEIIPSSEDGRAFVYRMLHPWVPFEESEIGDVR
jgi:replication initiation and membrane attachment protein DnaB